MCVYILTYIHKTIYIKCTYRQKDKEKIVLIIYNRIIFTRKS